MDNKNLDFLALLGFVMVKQSLCPELNANIQTNICIYFRPSYFFCDSCQFKHTVLSLLLFSKKVELGCTHTSTERRAKEFYQFAPLPQSTHIVTRQVMTSSRDKIIFTLLEILTLSKMTLLEVYE